MSEEPGGAQQDSAADAPKSKGAGDTFATWGCGLLVALPVLALAGCLGLAAVGGDDGDDDESIAVEAPIDTVRRGCERAVAQQLRAPSTAEFGENLTSSDELNASWTLTGIVDAQNGFGAMIRGTWSCTATYDDETQVASILTATLD